MIKLMPTASSAAVFVGSVLFVLSTSTPSFAQNCNIGAVGGIFTFINSGTCTDLQIQSNETGTVSNAGGQTIQSEFNAAVQNRGTVTVFTNAGTITGDDDNSAFQNFGIIESFFNSESITSDFVFVTAFNNNSSTSGAIVPNSRIGMFTNSGLIKGSYGIQNSGGDIDLLINTESGRIEERHVEVAQTTDACHPSFCTVWRSLTRQPFCHGVMAMSPAVSTTERQASRR